LGESLASPSIKTLGDGSSMDVKPFQAEPIGKLSPLNSQRLESLRVPSPYFAGSESPAGVLGSGTYALPEVSYADPAGGGSWSGLPTLWKGGDSGADIMGLAGTAPVGELRRLNGPLAFNAELPAGGSYIGYADRMGQRFFDVNDPAQGVIRVSAPDGRSVSQLDAVVVSGKRDMDLARFEALKDAVARGDRSVDIDELVGLGRRYDPTNPWVRNPTGREALTRFTTTVATGTAGMFTGGWAFGALRASGRGLLVSSAGAGYMGDLTTQLLDNGVSLGTGGRYGRTGINGWELAGVTALGAATPILGRAFELAGQAKDAMFGGLRFTSRVGEAYEQAIWSQRVTFAGHGTIADSATFVVPNGSSITFYAEPGATITNSLGREIEAGSELYPAVYRRTFGPGEVAPNPTLHPIEASWLAESPMGTRVVVEEPTALRDLMKPNVGVCHWAACIEDATLPASSYMYTNLGPVKKVGNSYGSTLGNVRP